jgi:hypothetical protein
LGASHAFFARAMLLARAMWLAAEMLRAAESFLMPAALNFLMLVVANFLILAAAAACRPLHSADFRAASRRSMAGFDGDVLVVGVAAVADYGVGMRSSSLMR